MKLPRNVGLVDLAVVTVVAVLVLLPGRQRYTSPLYKGVDAAQFAVALAEARTIANPSDGAALADYVRQLRDAGYKDWSSEVAVAGAKRAKGSPSEWQALLAASVAYVDKIQVQPALEYAQSALETCRANQGGCPKWEEVRMSLYEEHLSAGVRSGIDPRVDPKGFRKAGENALRSIRLNSGERERDQVQPVPKP